MIGQRMCNSCCGAGQINGLEMLTGISASSDMKAIIDKHEKPEETFEAIKAAIVWAKDRGYALNTGLGVLVALTNENQTSIAAMLQKCGFKRKVKFNFDDLEWKFWALDLEHIVSKEISKLKLKD